MDQTYTVASNSYVVSTAIFQHAQPDITHTTTTAEGWVKWLQEEALHRTRLPPSGTHYHPPLIPAHYPSQAPPYLPAIGAGKVELLLRVMVLCSLYERIMHSDNKRCKAVIFI